MTREDGVDVDEPIAGLPEAEAVEAVLARDAPGDESTDPGEVRAALDHVTAEGVVSREAAREALAEASKVVSTPGTRLEYASIAVGDAREAAEPVADIGVVRMRVDGIEARLSRLEAEVADLGERLRAVVESYAERENLYAVASGLRDVSLEAEQLHGALEDLRIDAEGVESWLGSHEARLREFEGDVDALAGNLDELAVAIDELGAAAGGGPDNGSDATDAASEPDVDLSLAWFDAALKRRITSLLVEDLRAELGAVRALAERDGIDGGGRLDEVEARLDDLAARSASLGDRLESIAEPDWRERFGDRLGAFESAADEFEPPIDWDEVQAALDAHRGGFDAAARPGSGGPGQGS